MNYSILLMGEHLPRLTVNVFRYLIVKYLSQPVRIVIISHFPILWSSLNILISYKNVFNFLETGSRGWTIVIKNISMKKRSHDQCTDYNWLELEDTKRQFLFELSIAWTLNYDAYVIQCCCNISLLNVIDPKFSHTKSCSQRL